MGAMDPMPTTEPVSKNVIDRRKAAASHGLAALLALLVGLLTGRVTKAPSDPDRDLVGTVSAALDRAQDYWSGKFAGRWRDARVVLLDQAFMTPCGVADELSGPFYCPEDQRVYLDLSFLRAVDGELARRYVIAHEIGHHVQQLSHRLGEERPSVDVELEADCFAGAWIRDEMTRGRVNSTDVESALAEAAAVGDDRLCPTCSPETWGHGSSEMRVAAVRRGMMGEPCAQN